MRHERPRGREHHAEEDRELDRGEEHDGRGTLNPFAQPVRVAADLTGVTFVRVALLLALAALSTAVATGCAADSSAPAKANLHAPVEPPAASPFVTIDSPGDRAVTARQDVLGTRAMTDVAGRGNAGDLVQVSTGCDDPRCAAGTQVDAAGHWTVRVLLKATKSYPRVRVVAQSGAQVAISLARLGLPEAKTRLPQALADAHRAPRREQHDDPGHGLARCDERLRRTGVASSSSSANLTPSRMVLVGDSLAVGIESPLTNALSGWSLTTNGRVSRPLAEGMGIVARHVRAPARPGHQPLHERLARRGRHAALGGPRDHHPPGRPRLRRLGDDRAAGGRRRDATPARTRRSPSWPRRTPRS